MMAHRIFSMLLLLYLALACTAPASRESSEENTPLGHPADLKSENGKWVLENEVILKIKEIESDLIAFVENSGSAGADPDFRKLADQLDVRVKEVFKACTMPDGPAHDALHEYLLELKKNIAALRHQDFADNTDKLHDLKDQLALFSQQFEN